MEVCSLKPDVTMVLLIFNEKENIVPLVEDILKVYRENNIAGEVLLGDDGSYDGSSGICDSIVEKYRDVRVFHHRADPESGHPIDNWNRAWTILHGFQKAEGEIVIIMDGDRQYDPGEIPQFIEKMNEGWDVVSGWRYKRADNFWRRFQSRVYNKLFISGIFGMDIKDQNSGFKAFRRELAIRTPFDPRGYKGIHRFILPIFQITGATMTEIQIEHYDRPAGSSYIKTSTVPFIFLSDLLFRFLPRFGSELRKIKVLKKELKRMPGPGDKKRILEKLGDKVYTQPER
ncbi:MAG: glycosyltransferase [Candidatus Thermoplasmatota archaeon]|nr:glycosyltransferase [Candidatus Thermoplasmatota archaeon]